MFPSDVKSVFVDDHTNSTDILLSATTTERTVFYSKIECDIPNENTITYGTELSQPNNNNILNSEYATQSESFAIRIIPQDENIHYFKTTATDHCNFTLVYSDNIASSTNILSVNGFTYGEILTILLLIMIFSLSLFSFIKNSIFGTKIDGIVKIISDNSKRL